MLIRRSALRHIGGVDAIRGRLTDDCALAAEIKKHGAIWLGLSTKVWSLLQPVAALLFTLMTLSSAIRYWRGRGGGWKGRYYKNA